MEYERTILELIERVKALEEKVDMILERQTGDKGFGARGGGDAANAREDRRKGDAGGESSSRENERGAAGGCEKGASETAGNGKCANETSGEEKHGEDSAGDENREDASDGMEDFRGAEEESGKGGNKKGGNGKGEKIGTAQIKAYIGSVVKSALDKGDEYIDLTANQIHKALGLTRRMPTVCNAMKQCMRECDEVLRKTASGYSSTFEVRYKKGNGANG